MRATIWSRTSCPYCVRAIDDLARRGFNIDIKYIGQNGITKQDLLSILPNAKTVPQIFIEDVHIGGYTDLVKYFTSDKK